MAVQGHTTTWPLLLLGHVAGWSALHLILFAPVRDLATMNGAPPHHPVLYQTVSAVVCMVVSALMGLLYQRLPEPLVRGWRAIGVVLCVSMAGTLGSLALLRLWSWGTDIGPWGPVDRRYNFFVFHLVRGTMQFGTWSALFFIIVLTQRIRAERERVLRAESLAHQAKLQMLRSQINPHFLFNALNSVVGLCVAHPQRAQAMVRDIAGLLRTSLRSDRTTTTLQDELDFIETYLRCEKERFGDRLSFEVRLPATIRHLAIPPMLLQPLVENAIKHGLVGTAPRLIQIIGHADNTGVHIEVRNQGALRTPSPTAGTGTGLRNVSERLQTLYPQSGSFSLEEEDGWVIAQIRYDPDEASLP